MTNTGAGNSDRELVVVSGSSGLIGITLINKLSESYRVVGLDNVGYPFPPITAECVCIDITSDTSMQNAMKRIEYGYGKRIASVIHLAAYYDFAGKTSPLYKKITVDGTERLLRVLKGFDVEQFIFSSSLLVYAPSRPGVKINEESLLEPKWDYPKSKVETEKVLETKRGKIPVLNLRISGIYTDEGESIPVTNQIQRIYENQITSHFYPGNLIHGNPFLHLDDLVSAIVKAVAKRKEFAPFETINLGEPITLSYGDIQQTVAKLLYNNNWKTYRIPKWMAKIGARAQDIFGESFIKPWMVDLADDHMELDIEKAKKLLDWYPQHNLKDTLPKMVELVKKEPLKFYTENKLKIPAKLKNSKL